MYDATIDIFVRRSFNDLSETFTQTTSTPSLAAQDYLDLTQASDPGSHRTGEIFTLERKE